LRVVADRSVFIEGSIREVRDAALIGGLLAVLVLYLFLGDFKTTAIIGVSIPMSLLITFAPLHLLDVSLNVMSLGGLALGVGMLVDNSIVVLESIFRCREEGDDLVTAAIRGTSEVRSAVISSTLTTVAVFLPMAFVEGIAGQTFTDLSLAVVTSLLASLAVALYFIPMLASRRTRNAPGNVAGTGGTPLPPPTRNPLRTWAAWNHFRTTCLPPGGPRRPLVIAWGSIHLVIASLLELPAKLLFALAGTALWSALRIAVPTLKTLARLTLSPLARLVGALSDRLQAAYPGWIRTLLARPLPVFAAVLACAWLTWELGLRLGAELLPEVHQGRIHRRGRPPGRHSPGGNHLHPLTGREGDSRRRGDIEAVLVTYGFDATNIKRSDEGEHTTRFKIDPEIPARIPPRPKSRSGTPAAPLRGISRRHGANRAPRPLQLPTPHRGGDPGDDLVALKDLSPAQALLAVRPELADVEASLRKGAPEIQVTYDRDRLALYGLNIGTVARQVRDLVKGFEATRFNLKDRRIPILVRLEEQDRAQVEDVGRLVVNPGRNAPSSCGRWPIWRWARDRARSAGWTASGWR
jgi:HAE1 family hydrophobic/amphiphilic exporter-1